MNPAIAHFSVGNILRDGATLLISSDTAVLLACFTAGWFVLRRFLKIHQQNLSEDAQLILAPLAFFFAFLALLLVAYLTHQQPIIFPRYGLILFTLGLPVLAWTLLRIREQNPARARRLFIGVVIILALDASIQFAGAVGTINQYHVQRAAAEYLRDHFDPKSSARIFCDDGNVKVFSGIPEERFVTSAEAPRDREGFVSYFKANQVEYLVFVAHQPRTPNRLFDDLEGGDYGNLFERSFNSHTRFLPTEIWVYRFHAENVK
jgi:hypothetical protein